MTMASSRKMLPNRKTHPRIPLITTANVMLSPATKARPAPRLRLTDTLMASPIP